MGACWAHSETGICGCCCTEVGFWCFKGLEAWLYWVICEWAAVGGDSAPFAGNFYGLANPPDSPALRSVLQPPHGCVGHTENKGGETPLPREKLLYQIVYPVSSLSTAGPNSSGLGLSGSLVLILQCKELQEQRPCLIYCFYESFSSFLGAWQIIMCLIASCGTPGLGENRLSAL